ncbi:hypothetical protein ACFLZX_04510 [Nanoarchaeota archaeon]
MQKLAYAGATQSNSATLPGYDVQDLGTIVGQKATEGILGAIKGAGKHSLKALKSPVEMVGLDIAAAKAMRAAYSAVGKQYDSTLLNHIENSANAISQAYEADKSRDSLSQRVAAASSGRAFVQRAIGKELVKRGAIGKVSEIYDTSDSTTFLGARVYGVDKSPGVTAILKSIPGILADKRNWNVRSEFMNGALYSGAAYAGVAAGIAGAASSFGAMYKTRVIAGAGIGGAAGAIKETTGNKFLEGATETAASMYAFSPIFGALSVAAKGAYKAADKLDNKVAKTALNIAGNALNAGMIYTISEPGLQIVANEFGIGSSGIAKAAEPTANRMTINTGDGSGAKVVSVHEPGKLACVLNPDAISATRFENTCTVPEGYDASHINGLLTRTGGSETASRVMSDFTVDGNKASKTFDLLFGFESSLDFKTQQHELQVGLTSDPASAAKVTIPEPFQSTNLDKLRDAGITTSGDQYFVTVKDGSFLSEAIRDADRALGDSSATLQTAYASAKNLVGGEGAEFKTVGDLNKIRAGQEVNITRIIGDLYTPESTRSTQPILFNSDLTPLPEAEDKAPVEEKKITPYTRDDTSVVSDFLRPGVERNPITGLVNYVVDGDQSGTDKDNLVTDLKELGLSIARVPVGAVLPIIDPAVQAYDEVSGSNLAKDTFNVPGQIVGQSGANIASVGENFGDAAINLTMTTAPYIKIAAVETGSALYSAGEFVGENLASGSGAVGKVLIHPLVQESVVGDTNYSEFVRPKVAEGSFTGKLNGLVDQGGDSPDKVYHDWAEVATSAGRTVAGLVTPLMDTVADTAKSGNATHLFDPLGQIPGQFTANVGDLGERVGAATISTLNETVVPAGKLAVDGVVIAGNAVKVAAVETGKATYGFGKDVVTNESPMNDTQVVSGVFRPTESQPANAEDPSLRQRLDKATNLGKEGEQDRLYHEAGEAGIGLAKPVVGLGASVSDGVKNVEKAGDIWGIPGDILGNLVADGINSGEKVADFGAATGKSLYDSTIGSLVDLFSDDEEETVPSEVIDPAKIKLPPVKGIESEEIVDDEGLPNLK